MKKPNFLTVCFPRFVGGTPLCTNLKKGREKLMKEMTYISLLIILIITLAGCNTNDSEKNGTSTNGGPQSAVKDGTKPYVRGVGKISVCELLS